MNANMPVVDYSKTTIYKIQHKEKDELLYVGSTTHFGNRKKQHKSRCYNHNGKLHDAKLYTTIRTNGDWDAFNMVIVKEFPCENKRQAEAEEDKVMREMKANLNMIRAYQSPEELIQYKATNGKKYYEKNREKYKERGIEYREQYKDKIKDRKKKYYEDNKGEILKQLRERYVTHSDKIKERTKEWREKNKEYYKEYNKEYRTQHIEKTKEYHKEWREKNKEQLLCECGGCFVKYNLANHLKTKKHQTFINQQTEQ